MHGKIVLSAKAVSWIDDSLYFIFLRLRPLYGGDRRKVILSPIYFFGSIPGIAVKDYKKIKKK